MTEEEKARLLEAVDGWARDLMEPFKDVPLTPEQERSARLWRPSKAAAS